jgi:hypothetical protein
MASLYPGLPGVMMAAHADEWERDDATHDVEDLTACLHVTMAGFTTEDLPSVVQRTVCPIAATIEGASVRFSCSYAIGLAVVVCTRTTRCCFCGFLQNTRPLCQRLDISKPFAAADLVFPNRLGIMMLWMMSQWMMARIWIASPRSRMKLARLCQPHTETCCHGQLQPFRWPLARPA